jgi:hypothetical protein
MSQTTSTSTGLVVSAIGALAAQGTPDTSGDAAAMSLTPPPGARRFGIKSAGSGRLEQVTSTAVALSGWNKMTLVDVMLRGSGYLVMVIGEGLLTILNAPGPSGPSVAISW